MFDYYSRRSPNSSNVGLLYWDVVLIFECPAISFTVTKSIPLQTNLVNNEEELINRMLKKGLPENVFLDNSRICHFVASDLITFKIYLTNIDYKCKLKISKMITSVNERSGHIDF